MAKGCMVTRSLAVDQFVVSYTAQTDPQCSQWGIRSLVYDSSHDTVQALHKRRHMDHRIYFLYMPSGYYIHCCSCTPADN